MLTSGKIKYFGGFKYQLAEDWWCLTPIVNQACRIDDPDDAARPWIVLGGDGKLSIKEGYAWDGPSGPTIDTPDFMRGSLAHDALYQLMRDGKLPQETREAADNVLNELCKNDGMGWFRRWYVHRALRDFAGFAAKRCDPKPTEAPWSRT